METTAPATTALDLPRSPSYTIDLTGNHPVFDAEEWEDASRLLVEVSSSPPNAGSSSATCRNNALAPPLAAPGPSTSFTIPEQTPEELLTEMFPDAHPDHISELLQSHGGGHHAVQEVIEQLFASNGTYRRRETGVRSPGAGKRGREEGEDGDRPTKRVAKRNYLEVVEWGMNAMYQDSCYKQLQIDYPVVPACYIKQCMAQHNNQYIPTFKKLADLRDSGDKLPYTPLMRGRNKGKDTGRNGRQRRDEGFEVERATLLTWIADGTLKAELQEAEMECGCCYSDYPFSKMVQCEDGHLFCSECARRAAENVIGLRKTEFKCLSSHGCVYGFSQASIQEFLPEKVYEGYLRLCQEKEVEMAQLSGFESCPFCPFGAILTTHPDVDKLFHCANTTCMIVSCRKCRRKNHIPLSCEEAQKENVLDAKHAIEEAMTQALLRECPKCKNKFYKEEGCNKMTCSCGQQMCYICRQPVKGYDHFLDKTMNPRGNKANTCVLWDDTNKRNVEDVKKALKEARTVHGEVVQGEDVKSLEIGLEAKPAVGPGRGPAAAGALAGLNEVLQRQMQALHARFGHVFPGAAAIGADAPQLQGAWDAPDARLRAYPEARPRPQFQYPAQPQQIARLPPARQGILHRAQTERLAELDRQARGLRARLAHRAGAAAGDGAAAEAAQPRAGAVRLEVLERQIEALRRLIDGPRGAAPGNAGGAVPAVQAQLPRAPAQAQQEVELHLQQLAARRQALVNQQRELEAAQQRLREHQNQHQLQQLEQARANELRAHAQPVAAGRQARIAREARVAQLQAAQAQPAQAAAAGVGAAQPPPRQNPLTRFVPPPPRAAIRIAGAVPRPNAAAFGRAANPVVIDDDEPLPRNPPPPYQPAAPRDAAQPIVIDDGPAIPPPAPAPRNVRRGRRR
ncbi:uncharacterized protein EV422DRAFT_123217 [Fimicolochytrium jonesii]|uniref:uncharacterized protein n=1 Tax=Fimicolochytrium jonesii TaxID=1396493 RepID=UPI0022FECE8F|nr:uncharacterized protein EV422DRAFT_123217 [Fimicolochytrium jonesii]KAI8819262.1 hypothetical protein EV422DRAFT_123217 [Fimicolochytrium jonesii]